MATNRSKPPSRSRLHTKIARAFASCATEADLVQVLYAELHGVFGYDSINLHVLEREGWYHSLAIDRGVLQDVRRRRLAESFFVEYYRDLRTHIIMPPPATAPLQMIGRGPGVAKRPRTLIWVPIVHGDRPVGSVSYQLFSKRDVPPDEIAVLERVHHGLGVLVTNAYLNELTRNQAVSLGALNAIARALSATHDEQGIAQALLTTLGPRIPADLVELIVRDEAPGALPRRFAMAPSEPAGPSGAPLPRRRLDAVREVLRTGTPRLVAHDRPGAAYRTSLSVPIVEGGLVRGALVTRSCEPDAYEQSTVAFLQQVADQVALALRNAGSYAAIEAQSRRLKIVDAVGARLASSLDRWSIMRSLREELANHLDFDLFSLAAITETPEGPVAEGYVYDSGEERPLPPVPLAAAGPSREAYETGRPVLVRRSPWARSLERQAREGAERVLGQGVVLDVTRPGQHRRVVSRSLVWMPVNHDGEIAALLSLQSYRADAFDDWHVQVLQDVATHVGLALANAEHFRAAQVERHRLEALHMLEMGVAGAGNERQIAEAVIDAIRCYLDAPILMLTYLDPDGQVTGYSSELGKPVRYLPPVDVEWTRFFRRLLASKATFVEAVPPDLSVNRPRDGWPPWGMDVPRHVLLVPLFSGDRVAGSLSALRTSDPPFTPEEVQLLESAAPAVGIALNTARLHRANELALAHSVRLQMVAGLAGHDLAGVVDDVAGLTWTMLDAIGAACWVFDDEGRVVMQAARGGGGPMRVLRWSGRTPARPWKEPPRAPCSGIRSGVAWSLIPVWYGNRLVGALGSVRRAGAAEQLPAAASEFAQHTAIAIENARLAAETRGRIHALEAVARFADLDITRPERARAEMCQLVERALGGSRGAMWLLEGSAMVRRAGGGAASRIAAARPEWWGPALLAGRSGLSGRRLRALLRSGARMDGGGPPDSSQGAEAAGRGIFARPVVVGDRVVGMLTAEVTGSSPRETRRLMAVLSGQAALVLGRLDLVAELNRQTEQLQTVLRHSPVGMVLEDAAGNVDYANPEVERIYGVAAGTLAGTPARRLLDQPDVVVVSDPEADPGGPLEVRLERTGTVVQVRQVPIPGSGLGAARVLTLHEDVTSQHAVLEAKELMLRAIGHEVRSPAAAMRSTLAGLLQWGTIMDEEQRRALLVEAYEQSQRLLSLVENQLLIARLETHRFEPRRDAVPLRRSVEQVLAVLRNRYADRVDVVHVRVNPELPDALCEPVHLDQVLSNLIGNALEYTSASRIEVTAETRTGWLEVTVSDDGPGVPADRRATLFARTAPAGQNRARGGLGLGLYLCRLVVERSFGGRIWLQDTASGGTTFRFTVPAAARRRRRSLRAAR